MRKGLSCVCQCVLKRAFVRVLPKTQVIVLQEDLYYSHPLIQDLLWDSLYIMMEPLLMRWPFT